MADTDVINKPKITPKETLAIPSQYVVVLHNDSMTPRTFVVKALKKCFQKIEPEANMIMMEAHENGHAVVAPYTKEIAESKAAKANAYSVENGYVLLFTPEKQ